MPDEEANTSKVRSLYGRPGRICGGYKCEGRCALPGETSSPAIGYRRREAAGGTARSQHTRPPNQYAR